MASTLPAPDEYGSWHDHVWRSRALGKRTRILIHLPHGTTPTGGFPVLYLLHGSGHDPDSVLAQVLCDGQVRALGDALLVIPEGEQGWWLDSPMIARARYQQHLIELAAHVAAHYRVHPGRQATGVCGFSMGGYGAVWLAERHPQEYGAVSSILGPLDIEAVYPEYCRLRLLLGDEQRIWSEHNPPRHMEALRQTSVALHTAVDAWDRLQNERFAAALQACGIAHDLCIAPGSHDVAFVRAHIGACLAWHRRAFDGLR